MSTDRSAEDNTEKDPPKHSKYRLSLFNKHPSDAEENEKDALPDSGGKATGDSLSPVSMVQLFRFSTKLELFFDFIGLLTAIAAGAGQPLMSLFFGKLVTSFVKFTTAVQNAKSGDPAAIADLAQAAADFRDASARNATWIVCLGIGIFVCTYTYMGIWTYTGEANAKRIRETYLRAVLRQDIQYFDNVGAGEVTTRIQNDTHLVQQGISEKIALIVSGLSSFVTGFVLGYIQSWKLALALSTILPCMIIAGGVMFKFISTYPQVALGHVASGGSLAEEVISTIRTTKAFGSEVTLSGMYDEHINKAEVFDIKTAMWNGGGLSVFSFIIFAAYGLVFSFGTTLINHGQASAGTVISVFSSILIGSVSLVMLPPELQAVTLARGAAAKLYTTIDRIPEIDSSSLNGFKPKSVDGEISLENVKFTYPSRPGVQVVKDLTLTFRAGKTAALVGASGSGKSTIVSLVERFYDPDSGVVKLDGINLKDLNLKWLRSQIGLVSQEPTLFSTTIKENVGYGLINTPYEYASEEEKFVLIKEACVKANADEFITKLPMGYDTPVGERGFLLSGGQKQRVAIARAIVSDPRILLLDEATSALDTQSEGIVQDALDKATAGRTTITIAHRLSTIKDADVIYVMGDGQVLEQGTHNELISASGAYARLVQAQKLREGQGNEQKIHGQGNVIDDGESEDMEKSVREKVPLSRKNTEHSLASDALEQKRKDVPGEETAYLSLLTIFVRFGDMVRDQWRNYFFGFTFAVMNGMVWPALGLVYATGIQGFSLSSPAERRFHGDRTALWFLVIAILAAIAAAFQNYIFSASAARLTSRLRSTSFKAILRQDVEFFDAPGNNTGGLTADLSGNPQKVNALAGITLGAIFQSLATLVSGSILGLVFIWRVALVGIACMPVLVSLGYIRLHVVVLKDQANKAAHNASANIACEAAGSIRTVAALTREEDYLDLYSKSLEITQARSSRTAIRSNGLYAFSQSATFFVIALVFWYGSLLVSRQQASTFQFFVGLMSTTFGAVQAGNLFSFMPDVSSAKSAASDIIRLLDSTPQIDAESSEGKNINSEKCHGHIRFENVHFRYPTRPGVRVLRGISLAVEPGTYIALVGASGSGKSTVIQLIERFYDPLAGEIYLDNERISELNIRDYRRHMALVSQEPTLYAGTIRFNILLGAIKPISDVSQEELEDACRKANILDYINSLPDGFDTEVGGKGSQLSGGQKQRIAIARALLRNPKVLLLDEATSALDSNSEKVVQEALDQAAKGRTTIAIAHRLSTIQNADRIYFIKEGSVSESGTHDQLLAKRGDYYEYVQLQALSKQ